MPNTPLSSNDLVASFWTLAGAGEGQASPRGFEERVAAAAAAGWAGIGLRYDDYDAARRQGLSVTDLRSILKRYDQLVPEVEFISGWSSHDAAVRERSHQAEERLYQAADAFGARHVNVGCSEALGGLAPIDEVAGRFAALCRRAAAHGLLVAIEFMPWTGIPDVKTAWEIAGRAGEPNGGILLDTWHYFRGNPDEAALRSVPAERIFVIQFNDADAEVVDSLRYDTMHKRRLPGEGTFDLAGFVRLIDELGIQAPICVEVIADDQNALRLEEASRRAYETSRRVLDAARSASR